MCPPCADWKQLHIVDLFVGCLSTDYVVIKIYTNTFLNTRFLPNLYRAFIKQVGVNVQEPFCTKYLMFYAFI